MIRAVFMAFFLVVAPEEASALQTLLGQKLKNVEAVAHKIASSVSSRRQKSSTSMPGNWEVCDQCDITNENLDPDRFCKPGTADYCDAKTCDTDNPFVNHPGWWCSPGTSKVIVSSYEYKRADTHSIIHVNQPRSQQRKFGAMYAIPPARSWTCVPCDPENPTVAGKWCKPKTADECNHPCDPCDPENPDVNKKGWFCRRGTADVCVDHYGMTVVNYAASKFDANGTVIEIVMPGAAIQSLSCNNYPWCVWGSVAGALLVVVVTGGIAAAAMAPAGGLPAVAVVTGATYTTGSITGTSILPAAIGGGATSIVGGSLLSSASLTMGPVATIVGGALSVATGSVLSMEFD